MMDRLRIATFNLENLDDRGEALDDRIAVLRPQLLRLRADLLCLQEVGAEEHGKNAPRVLGALDRLIEGTPYAQFHRLVSLNRKGLRFADHHNLVILSRLPFVEREQVWHDLVAPPRHQMADGQELAVEWDRPVLHGVVGLPDGRRLHVLNVHLRAPRAAFVEGQKDGGRWESLSGWAEGFFLASVKQAGQALEARLLLERIFDAEGDALIAVCGDFNAADREAPVRIIRGDEEDAGNGHLARRVLVPLDRTIPMPQRYSVIHHGERVMLDHVLVSRGLLGWYAGAEVHNEILGDELVSPLLSPRSPETFHAPVVAEFLPPVLEVQR